MTQPDPTPTTTEMTAGPDIGGTGIQVADRAVVFKATPPPVQVAISRVMADVLVVKKDQRNNTPGASFDFRGIDQVVNALAVPMRKHGVVPVPHRLLEISYHDVIVGKNRTEMCSVRVRMQYRLYGPAGDFLKVEAPGEAFDSGDKATAKAMSVALRTALLQVFALPTNQPDPDSVSYERSSSQPEPEPMRPDFAADIETAVAAGNLDRLRELWTEAKAADNREAMHAAHLAGKRIPTADAAPSSEGPKPEAADAEPAPPKRASRAAAAKPAKPTPPPAEPAGPVPDDDPANPQPAATIPSSALTAQHRAVRSLKHAALPEGFWLMVDEAAADLDGETLKDLYAIATETKNAVIVGEVGRVGQAAAAVRRTKGMADVGQGPDPASLRKPEVAGGTQVPGQLDLVDEVQRVTTPPAETSGMF